jgi:hypothetical protein
VEPPEDDGPVGLSAPKELAGLLAPPQAASASRDTLRQMLHVEDFKILIGTVSRCCILFSHPWLSEQVSHAPFLYD